MTHQNLVLCGTYRDSAWNYYLAISSGSVLTRREGKWLKIGVKLRRKLATGGWKRSQIQCRHLAKAWGVTLEEIDAEVKRLNAVDTSRAALAVCGNQRHGHYLWLLECYPLATRDEWLGRDPKRSREAGERSWERLKQNIRRDAVPGVEFPSEQLENRTRTNVYLTREAAAYLRSLIETELLVDEVFRRSRKENQRLPGGLRAVS